MIKGFKEFVMRGNVIDLAVAVVIGAAFNTVVERVVESLVNPVVGIVFQADSLDSALMIPVGNDHIALGAVIGALINFVIVAAVVYFAFVLPMNKAREHRGPQEIEEAPSQEDLLTEIRDLLREQRGTNGPTVPGSPLQ